MNGWKWLLLRGGVYFAPDEGGSAGGAGASAGQPVQAQTQQNPGASQTQGQGQQQTGSDDDAAADDTPDDQLEAKFGKTAASIIRAGRREASKRRVELRELRQLEEQRKQQERDAETERAKQAGDFTKVEAQYKKDLETANTTIVTLRKQNIGLQLGLPMDLASRITGNTEEEMRADAEKLKALIAPQQQTQTQQQKPGARGFPGTTTTAVPGGQAVGETYQQKKNRVYGGSGRTSFGG